MSVTDIADTLKARNGAVGAAAVLAMMLLMLLMLPILAAFHAQHRQITGALDQLARLRAEAATAPVARQRLAEMRGRMEALTGTLRAATAAVAQSQLQQAMEAIATTAGATIRSTQMLPQEKAGHFETVAIQYDIAVPMSRLAGLLYGIESHVPYLFVDNAEIGAGQNWQANAPSTQDPQLDVRWTVRAYRWEKPR